MKAILCITSVIVGVFSYSSALILACLALSVPCAFVKAQKPSDEVEKVVIDTDIGDDIDDVLARISHRRDGSWGKGI
jgi:hypothetical protein